MLSISKFSPRSFDWSLLIATMLLVVMGLASIYSVDLSRGGDIIYFKKQIIAFGIGVVLLLFTSLNQHTIWRYLAKWIYLLSLLLLTGVLLFGDTIRGTRGWFSLAGFSFQPVEIAKIALILMLAYVISGFGRRFERPLFFIGTGIIAFIPFALTTIQPDLGSALLLLLVWFGLI